MTRRVYKRPMFTLRQAFAILAVATLATGSARADLAAKKGPDASCGPGAKMTALARMLELHGEAVAATKLYEEACQHKDGSGCYQLGTQFNLGQGGVPKDPSRAKVLFAQAAVLVEAGCRAGCQPACVTLGWMLHTEQGVARDGRRSIALLTSACERGAAEGCFLLGTMHAFGYETPKDVARAVAAYRRACELGDPLGCNSMAYSYENGNGLPRDAVEASRLYRRSCDLGMEKSCKLAK
jgi:uncharacterized protein